MSPAPQRHWWQQLRTTEVTLWVAGLMVVGFIAQFVSGGEVTRALGYSGAYTDLSVGAIEPALIQPWRMVTVALVHSTTAIFATHLLFNLLAYVAISRQLAPVLGQWSTLWVFVVSVLGGSAGVALLDPHQFTIGASGGVFGLFAAMFIVLRRLGGDVTGIVAIVGINLALNLVMNGVSWQAHVGGLAYGALAAAAIMATRGPRQRRRRTVALVVVSLFAVASPYLAMMVHPLA